MRVNLDSYLRANTTDRYAAYTQALDPETGWMTRDEVRALEELPPWADVAPAADPSTVPEADDTAPDPQAPQTPAGEPTDTTEDVTP